MLLMGEVYRLWKNFDLTLKKFFLNISQKGDYTYSEIKNIFLLTSVLQVSKAIKNQYNISLMFLAQNNFFS